MFTPDNPDLELEAQPRATGHYLANIPGLTSQRMSELYRGILVATGDPHSRANLTHFAAGGMRLAVIWTQAGIEHKHVAEIKAPEIAAVLDRDEDQFFTDWATEQLEAVRRLSLAIERDPATPAIERNFGRRVRAAAGNFMAFAAKRRIDRLVEKAQPKEK